MAEVDFRELVLTDAQLEGNEPAPPVPEGLSDPTRFWPELEVVASSFSDSVVIHRMDDHDELIMLLMSRGQAYVRDADGLEGPRILTAEELASHLEGLGDGGLQAVPWSTPLLSGVAKARGFLSLFEDPVFQKLARSSQVVAEYGTSAEQMEGRPMRDVVTTQSKGTIKAIVSAVATHVGERGAAAALGQALGLRSAWTRDADIATEVGCDLMRYHDAVDVFEHPKAFLSVAQAYGLDTAREYLKGFLALKARDSWQLEQASVIDFLEITERLGVTMKPKAFLSYAISQRMEQGANIFDATHWIDTWADTLAMQDIVHGEIDDKYPQELLVTHDRLINEAMRVRHALTETQAAEERIDPFEKHRLELEVHSFEDETFFIRPPKNVEEMLEEARLQHNCLAGYVKAFEHGDTDIYLMRETRFPARPCVTVEVRNGRVRQAFQRNNSRMTADQQAWFDRWCDANSIERLERNMALGVGLHYDEPGRAVNPMVAARRQDRNMNRPGTWHR